MTVLPQGESVDAQFMINYLKDTGKRFQNLKKNKVTLQELHFQNPDGQCSRNKAVPGPEGVPLVSQSPYSPDLNLLDRFLFRHIKMDLRGEDFSCHTVLYPTYLGKYPGGGAEKTQITSRRCNCVSRGLYFSIH